jgi:hypothetical protein
MAGMLVMGRSSFAGRPLAIDDADPVDVRQFEFEGGVAYSDDSDCKHWDFPFGLTYGLVPGVEVGAGFGGQFEKRNEVLEDGRTDDCSESGLGDLAIGVKWQFLKECPLGARHAIVPVVKFPTADDDKELGSGETDYDLTWIASRSLGDKAGAHVNAGYSWIGKPDDEDADDVVHYGVALDYQITGPVQWVGEVFAEKELNDEADTVVQYNTGFRWTPADNLTLDIAGGSKLSGEAPDFTATAGLTWAFGFANNESN